MGRKRVSREVNLTEGNFFKNILFYTVPIALMGMLQVLYNAADVIVVGKFGEEGSLAAVGSTGSAISLIINCFLGLSVGAAVDVAQRYGAGDIKGVSESVHTAISISAILGVFISVCGMFLSEPLLTAMSTPEELIPKATLYMKIYFIGVPASLVFNFACGIMRSVGDSGTQLKISVISGITNVILNLVFVIIFKLDVAGVAIATVVSTVLSATLAMRALICSGGAIKFSFRCICIKKSPLINIIKIGLPSGINGTLFGISNVMIQKTINSFGAFAVAGNAAASNIDGLEYQALNSLYQAAISFAGQSYGAKKYDNFKKIIKVCFTYCVVINVIFTVAIIPFGKFIFGIFTDVPMEIEYARRRELIMVTTYFLCGFMDVLTGMIRSIGKSTAAMIISIFGICVFRLLWIYTMCVQFPTPECLYLSYPISWILTASFNGCVFKYLVGKLRKNNS